MFFEPSSPPSHACDHSLSAGLVITIDALVRVDPTGPDGESHLHATEMPVDVRRHRSFGSPIECVFPGTEDRHIELPVDSARPIATALTRVVAA